MLANLDAPALTAGNTIIDDTILADRYTSIPVVKNILALVNRDALVPIKQDTLALVGNNILANG